MLSSEGAERRGAHPLGPARYDAPPCRAGHGSPGALVLPLPQGQFPRNAVPCGAGMRPLSGGGARESLCLPRGRDGRRSRRGVGALGRGPEPQHVRDPRQRLRALKLSHQARREAGAESSSLCGKMASVMPRRRSAVPGGFPGDNTGAGQCVSFC